MCGVLQPVIRSQVAALVQHSKTLQHPAHQAQLLGELKGELGPAISEAAKIRLFELLNDQQSGLPQKIAAALREQLTADVLLGPK
jgi:hypothetical protein